MVLNSQQIATREKLILAGLYFSKFDLDGVRKLGFGSFLEAFNVVGYALGAKPASVKNYRDEFDPLFPNRRKGWHKRATRQYCLRVFNRYGDLDLGAFSSLVRSLVGYDENAWSGVRPEEEEEDGESPFAKRLITGLAAEHYFESVQHGLPEFKDCALENTTRLGCGYDFRLRSEARRNFLAVEVKGLTGRAGTVALTPKEHAAAAALSDRFFLFVVKNFAESPFHEIHQDPLAGKLRFAKKERVVVHTSWLANV
ncbi:MAG: DUF3883 domain-containing protein [Bryobacteraceae bacterium]|jgi:hypothetical protein